MLKIGFDAKRLFLNGTGLGNYSRSLVRSLNEFYPENTYVLFSPKIAYNDESFYYTQNFETVTPSLFTSKSIWRTKSILNSLLEHDIDIYHGLSHELPVGIENTSVKSVVTIHDLIYKLFPMDFPLVDKKIYEMKWRNSCKNANAIIATSEATKKDIVENFNIDESKIHVVYQTCSDIFDRSYTDAEKHETLERLGLPKNYMLYVGAITDRKNVMSLVEAYNEIKNEIDIPLVIVGKGRSYMRRLMEYVLKHNLKDRVIVNSEILNNDLPIVYQCAEFFLYPSRYEGFGIPILEAFKSKTPVILSNTTSLPEVGGTAGYYIDPYKVESISQAILDLHSNPNLRNRLIDEGLEQVKQFTIENFAKQTIAVYNKVM